MRVYYTRVLLHVLDGSEDSLYVEGRLATTITDGFEKLLNELPHEIAMRFNKLTTTLTETIDYWSTPIITMPDEFSFHLDVESMGRLARETLIGVLPLDTNVLQARGPLIAELWIGGRGEALRQDERPLLESATREVRALPVRGKVFVLGDDIQGINRVAGVDAIRHAGGTVREKMTADCDYYVTDQPENETPAGITCKQVINQLVLRVMLESKY